MKPTSSWVTASTWQRCVQQIAGHAPCHESMAGRDKVCILLRTLESNETILCLYDYYL